MEGHSYLAKVNALEPGTGTRFMFITFAEDYSTIRRTTDPVGEKEIRAAMREMGMPESSINARIANAPFVP